MRHRLIVLPVGAMLMLGGLTACGSDAESPDTTASTELANPASEFCVEQGGTVEIVDDGYGQRIGYCNLPDGTRVEEFEYFRAEGGGTTEP
jgi:uncharacterized protein